MVLFYLCNFLFCVIIVPFDSIIMYIFGVYECVFSVVAVGLQPFLCKGLKETIVQSQ